MFKRLITGFIVLASTAIPLSFNGGTAHAACLGALVTFNKQTGNTSWSSTDSTLCVSTTNPAGPQTFQSGSLNNVRIRSISLSGRSITGGVNYITWEIKRDTLGRVISVTPTEFGQLTLVYGNYKMPSPTSQITLMGTVTTTTQQFMTFQQVFAQ